MISKIFGRKKKSAPTPKEPVKEVESATFSAQFPPPEWVWYREQEDKKQRIQKWVQQVPPKHVHGQISNESTYGKHIHPHAVPYGHHNFQPRPRVNTMPTIKAADDYEEIDDLDLNPNVPSTLPAAHHDYHQQHAHRRMSESRVRRKEHKSQRRSLDRKTTEQIYHNLPVNQGMQNLKPQFESPSLPYHTDVTGASQVVTHPMYSSTPRTGPWAGMEVHPRLNPHCEQMETRALEPGHPGVIYPHHHHHHRNSKSKRKSHRHHINTPNADISTEYCGRLPKKGLFVGHVLW